MPSSHSGYLQLKLETGRIGYWIFLIFMYSSLYYLERVRRHNPVRAWCFLSIEIFTILINLTDTVWVTLTPLWLLYLIVVAESIRYYRAPVAIKRPSASTSARRIDRSTLVAAHASRPSYQAQKGI